MLPDQAPLNSFDTRKSTSASALPTLQDQATLNQALNLLGQIQNLPNDEAHMRQLGINVIFRNGQEALQVIRGKGIRVEFGDMGDSPAHAQWLADQNLIMINRKYRGDTSAATLYAISEAIYHEAGHATKITKDPRTGSYVNQSLISNNPADTGDDQSSIQEELNCLALNTLAHRYHEAKDPNYALTTSSSRLLSDGVALYAKLFFDPDPNKTALVNRVVEKYGDLPLSSPGHEPPQTSLGTEPVAYRVLQKASTRPKPQAGFPQAAPTSLSSTYPPPPSSIVPVSAPRFSYMA